MNDTKKVVAERLKEAREFLGLTQQQVAHKTGIQRTSLSAIECGQRDVAAQELVTLAGLYRRPVKWVLGEEEPLDLTDLVPLLSKCEPGDRLMVVKFAEFLSHAGEPLRNKNICGCKECKCFCQVAFSNEICKSCRLGAHHR